VPTVLNILETAKITNPKLRVLGALPLASGPCSKQDMKLPAKERLVYREYEAAFAAHGIPMFRTMMFRSATTVEEARSNADLTLLHWTARRRFQRLFAEVHFRIKTVPSRSPIPHVRIHHSRPQ